MLEIGAEWLASEDALAAVAERSRQRYLAAMDKYELHEAAADMDAIRAARRFKFSYREQIYRAAARSRSGAAF